MGLARSTYYDGPASQPIEEARLVERIKEICAKWPAYGYRRVTAQLHAEGMIVNHKKLMRLMREHDLTVRPRRRFMATTDSDHDGPIFPNLAKDMVPTGPNQLWVADITYIAIAVGFVYLAAILDAWSGRVVGYAINRRVDARLALCGTQSGDRRPSAAARLYPPFRSRLAICCRGLPRRSRGARSQRLHGPAWQSLRQCQGRELHEDLEGGGGLAHGVRELRRRCGFVADTQLL
jgi:putative transposase